MSAESSPPSKKHRVIGWKPENSEADNSPRGRFPRWVSIVGGVAAVLFLLFTVRAGYVLWQFEKERRASEFQLASGIPAGASLNEAFAAQSRAEMARDEAMRGFQTISKAPTDHPTVLQRIVALNRTLDQAHKAYGDRKYAQAVALYQEISNETKSFADALDDRTKAQEGLDRFRVENTRIEPFKNLAPEVYEAALTAAGAAQTFLNAGSFTPARQKMDEALATLLSIEESMLTELEERLAEGRAALARGDGEAATAAFGRALQLQPENELAKTSLERAKTIEATFARLAEAQQLEESNALEQAQQAYEAAFAIDKQSARAQAGIARVKAAIEKRDFDAALTRARTAREAKKWEEAIAGYQDALKVFPDDKEVQTALADARVRQREAYIQSSLAEAYALERSHSYDAAKAIYLKLVQFEPGQADAEEGILRTGRVIRALLNYETRMEEARSHAQRANFQAGINAFNEAMNNKPSYLELSPEDAQLRTLLEKQSQPVPVAFVSDNRTWVTIAGEKLLGKFQSTTVPLKPGNYEVIGRRKGYEDVREVIRIRAGEPIPPITIVCNKR